MNHLLFAAACQRKPWEEKQEETRVYTGVGRAEETSQSLNNRQGWCSCCTVQMRKQRLGELESLPVLLPASSRSLENEGPQLCGTDPCLISLCLCFHICEMGRCLRSTDLVGQGENRELIFAEHLAQCPVCGCSSKSRSCDCTEAGGQGSHLLKTCSPQRL